MHFRRLRIMRISDTYLEWSPDTVLDFMRDMIVLRAEMKYEWRAVEYVVYSKYFDEVPEGCSPPVYDVEPVVSRTREGNIIVTKLRFRKGLE